MNTITDLEMPDLSWKNLWRTGGAAALLMAVLIPIQVIFFVIWPPPGSVDAWFELFHDKPLVGLLDMDLLMIVDQVLMALVVVALYTILRRTHPSAMMIAMVLALLGIAAYLASTSAFEMLSLSRHYANTHSLIEKSFYISAGEAELANWQGTAFNVGYVIEGIALLIIALVMLRNTIFSKTTAVIGIVMGIMALLPPTAGKVGMFFALGSLVPLEIWNIMVAIRLFGLANKESS
jgi:hypothetical protein